MWYVKLAIIDVKLYTRGRKVVHIEIQLKVTPELKNRIILYDAKLITEQIGSGDDDVYDSPSGNRRITGTLIVSLSLTGNPETAHNPQ